MGILLQVEDGMWIATLGAYEKMYPPMKDDQLQEYAENVVWHPEIADLLRGSKMLAPAGNNGSNFLCTPASCSFAPAQHQMA